MPREEIACIEAEIDLQAAVNENAKLLMSMTGIETFAAMLLVSEIGDITRFKTRRQAGLMDRDVPAGLPVRQRDAPRPHEKGVKPEGKLDNDPGRQRGGAP